MSHSEVEHPARRHEGRCLHEESFSGRQVELRWYLIKQNGRPSQAFQEACINAPSPYFVLREDALWKPLWRLL